MFDWPDWVWWVCIAAVILFGWLIDEIIIRRHIARSKAKYAAARARIIAVEPQYVGVCYNTGYVILNNGDILTSDGQPISIDVVQMQLAESVADKKLNFKFRKPTSEEYEMYKKEGIW